MCVDDEKQLSSLEGKCKREKSIIETISGHSGCRWQRRETARNKAGINNRTNFPKSNTYYFQPSKFGCTVAVHICIQPWLNINDK